VALELIQGLDIIDFIQTCGPLSEGLARFIFKQLVAGLSHIHDKGYCHRDIKSDNIIITEGCVPKILDFGFAKKKNGNVDMMYTKIVTPEYMAPEILAGAGYKGDEVDIFALSIILF